MKEPKTILITPAEAAKLIGIGLNTMYEDLLKREDFPAFQINKGGKYFVNREQLQTWADKQCPKSR